MNKDSSQGPERQEGAPEPGDEPAGSQGAAASEPPSQPPSAEPATTPLPDVTIASAGVPPGQAVGPPPPAGPPAPGAPTGPEAPPRKRRTGLIILAVAGGLGLVLCLGGVLLAVNAAGGEIPQVDDCLNDSADPNEMTVVDCGAAEAAWTVIGADATMTRGEFSGLTQDAVCQDHPGTERALWVTESLSPNDDTEGQVLCLQRVDAAGGS